MSTALPNVESLAVPLLLGHLFNCMFHGAFLVQVYVYFVGFPRDKRVFKSLVFALLLLENLQTGLTIFDAVSAFGKSFGDVPKLEQVRLQWFTVPVLSAPISWIVQMFFAYRVSVLAQSRKKAAPLVVLSAIQGIVSLIGGISEAVLNKPVVTNLQGQRFSPVVIWLGTTFLCDVSIAGAMIYCLRRADTSVPTTLVLLQRVKRNALETGALTAGVATMTLMLWVAFPGRTFWATPASIVTKIYSNSLLATLNSRKQDSTTSSGMPLSDVVVIPESVWNVQPNVEAGTSTGSGAVSSTGSGSRVEESKPRID